MICLQIEAVLEHAVEAYHSEPGPDQGRVVAIHPEEAQILGGYPAVIGISVGYCVVELAGAPLGVRYLTRGIPKMQLMPVDKTSLDMITFRLHICRPGVVVSQTGEDRRVGEELLYEPQPDAGVFDVALPRLLPDVVGRKVSGHQDEVNVGMVLADLRHHVSESPFGHVAEVVAPVTSFLSCGFRFE